MLEKMFLEYPDIPIVLKKQAKERESYFKFQRLILNENFVELATKEIDKQLVDVYDELNQ